jgi:predicted nucleotidyltransferase
MMGDYLFEISKKLRKKFGNKIVKIILFGSYARGDYSAESDIDLLLVVKDDSIVDIEDDIRKIIYSFIPAVGRLISVKIVGAEKYAKMKEINHSFIQSLEREGIVIG